MKAACYYETGPPSVFRYEDVPDPKVGPGDVLVDVEAISIEGGDTLNRAGGEMASSPHIVGYQCAGTIAEVGPDVKDRQPGQRVVCTMLWGSHAERVATPSIVTWVVPDGLDIVEAACVPVPWGTADDCLFEFGHLQAGETVLIQAGGGGVGLAAIQLAKRAGATVLATASSDEKLERLREYGMDHGINYRDVDFADAARELTGGRGVDLVVDPVGSTLSDSVRALAYRGRVTLVGPSPRRHRRRQPARRRRPDVPAVRRRRCPRVHREPPGLRPRGADPLARRQAGTEATIRSLSSHRRRAASSSWATFEGAAGLHL